MAVLADVKAMQDINKRFNFHPKRLVELLLFFLLTSTLLLIILVAEGGGAVISLDLEFVLRVLVAPLEAILWDFSSQITTPVIIALMVLSLFIKNNTVRRLVMQLSVVLWIISGIEIIMTHT